MPSLRKLSRRETVLVTALGVVIAVLTTWWLWPAGSLPLVGQPSGSGPEALPIPRVALARLDAPRPGGEAGRRNLFEFGSAPVPAATPPPPVVVATPPPAVRPGQGSPGLADSAPAVPSLPPLNVKYIGSVENAAGIKVAVLVTDRQEVLTGQSGQVIANRYRIARIGLESVDLEDISTGQSRRVPLRGS
jgi:hypothetical protein